MFKIQAKLTYLFFISVGSVAQFGSSRSPRVIWTSIDEGKQKLITLCEHIKESLLQTNITIAYRTYIPHITLGRVSKHNKINSYAVCLSTQHIDIPYASMSARNVAIIQSHLTKTGAHYEIIETCSLAIR